MSASSENLTLRTAEPNDFQMLAQLGRDAFFAAFGNNSDADDMQQYLNQAFSPESIKEHLHNPQTTFLVAEFNFIPVGYAKIKRYSTIESLSTSKVVQLERIYVLPEFIGQKIGSTLMQACIDICVTEQFEYLWLGVWQQNKLAISFYHRIGFEIIGYKQFIIGKEVNEDFVMALKL